MPPDILHTENSFNAHMVPFYVKSNFETNALFRFATIQSEIRFKRRLRQ